MYLSDREMEAAIKSGRLIVEPATEIGPTSIDLHLDKVEQAKVWDLDTFRADNRMSGHAESELNIGKFQYGKFSQRYLKSLSVDPKAVVFLRNRQVVVRPNGFLLWQTLERVGTPEKDPDLILFIDGKSTRTARTGLVVHLTAPTIHAGWSGKVTLELANLGPFDIVLTEGDAVAQIVVATISSVPAVSMAKVSTTHGQGNVSGLPG